MTRNVKFVLNRKNFREQILQGPIADEIEAAAHAAAPANTRVESDVSGPRARVRVYGSLREEAQNGQLSRVLGQVRL